MRKLITFLFAVLLATASVLAQAPQKMSYQSVIRNSGNALITSKAVGMRISILQGSSTGTAVYVETQMPTTNSNGLVSLEIGSGNVILGTFSTINWGAGPYFIKTETDPLGGVAYSISGTSQLMSVPYALFSANGTPGPAGATGATGPQGATGATGPQGVKGNTGATGAQGFQGPIGPTGTTGDKGEPGANGAAGPTGPTGATGAAGTNGANGLTTSVNGVTQINGAITLTPSNLGLGNVDNTSDINKPVSTATQTELFLKVDKVAGKGLSTNDYTTAEQTKLAAITGTNTGDQDLSGKVDVVAGKGLSTNDYTTPEKTKLADITGTNTGDQDLSGKVDKVSGKGLSTNDYTTAEQTKLAAISGTNTGDQDLTGINHNNRTALDLVSGTNTGDQDLSGKVDKVSGKGLSTNDYTTADQTKLAAISGTNTGDQDLSGKVDKETGKGLSTNDYTTADQTKLAAISGTNTGDQDLSTKVDKVTGKGLSTNDYTTADQTKLAAISGTNTGDQDLTDMTHANRTDLDLVSGTNTGDQDLSGKVDKVSGKGLSTNDYTTTEKTKLAAISGTNTGDQDLTDMAHANRTALDLVSGINTGDQDLSGKVDKEAGKGLSTNDYTTSEQLKLSGITGTNTGDQDLSTKVDKVTGKGLTSNDYTTAEQTKLAAISGTNTGDQDLTDMAHANRTDLDLVSGTNTGDQDLSVKVDKVTGKGLSTHDYTTAEQTKLAAISGTNTGDQDLTDMAHANRTALDLVSGINTGDQDLSGKVDKEAGKGLSTNDYTTSEQLKLSGISGTNTGDQDLSVKVDKVTGQGLSTNDYTTNEKNKLAAISGTNTGDQDLTDMAHANRADLDLVSGTNTGDQDLTGKVDKVAGKGLSTNDYTTSEQTKLAAITGTNTGDQNITDMTHANRTELDLVSGTNTGDQDLTGKVDKVTGKGLSTNDYTTAEQTKVSNLSGTNTGDNATNTQYSGLVTNATHTGDATGATALTLATVNSNIGTFNNITINAKGLATAASNVTYLTPTGSAASLTNFPTLNQNTTGTAANVTGTVAVANGGTGTTNGSMTGTGALTFAAGGSNQNVTLTPSGTGKTVLNGAVGIGTSTPDASAKLEISSTTQAFLPPRMTTTQRDAISSPASGSVIYNTTIKELQCYNEGSTPSVDGTGSAGSYAQYDGPAQGQTIQTLSTGLLISVEAQVAIRGSSGIITAKVYDAVNGTLIATADNTVSAPWAGAEFNFVAGTWTFTTANLTLNSGTTYYIEFHATNNNGFFIGTSYGVYARGSLYTGAQGSVSAIATGDIDFIVNYGSSTAAAWAGNSTLVSGTNTGDQDLSGKVDKVSGKGLSTNDYTTAEQTKVSNLSGTNTGDQDLSGKVDKVSGKGLSTNDYTTAEQTKVSNLSGTNTGDNATNTQYSGLVTNATHTGDATGGTALTLATVNSNIGTFNNITINAKGLATAGSNVTYLTPTGSAASLTSFPTFNQSTTGTAANVTGTVAVANGGTGTTNGSMTGTGALTFAAGGSNQNVTLTPSGTGKTVLNGAVGIGTSTPEASAKLDVSSTTQLFFPPRMTTAQRDAIASPASGGMLFNTTTNKLQVAVACPNLDNTGTGTTLFNPMASGQTMGQTFTATANNSISNILLNMTYGTWSVGTITCKVYDSFGGTLLSSSGNTADIQSFNNSFNFTGLNVTAGQVYYVEFTIVYSNAGALYHYVGTSYSGGNAYYNNVVSSYDLSFKVTYGSPIIWDNLN